MILKIAAAILVSFAVVLIISVNIGKDGITGTDNTENTDITVSRETETKPEKISVTPMPAETEPSGTGITTSAATVYTEPDIEYYRKTCVYSVWYDAVESNPADYKSIESAKAFALKGVFYFSSLITEKFETRLYKDDEVFLTGEVKMRDNVTAEADFSAGLEGIGTFSSGEYYIELLYEGETVAVTPKMRVI